MSLYTEPRYLEAAPTTALLSDTRPTKLSPAALSAINATLDELLQLFIHASLIPPTGTSPPSVNGSPPLVAGPLGPKDVYTTERFAAGVRRVVGPNLGKNVVLEAELAIRELLKMSNPSMRGDGALRKGSFGGGGGDTTLTATTQADDLFRLLREWVMAISGLGAGCPPTGPMNLAGHLLALSPPPAPPLGTMSPQITFIVALYAERCVCFLGEYLARAVGRVTERGQNESAGLIEVEAAFAEDDTIWSWLRGMRVRQHIESEVAAVKSKAAGVSSQSPAITSAASLPSSRASTVPSLSGRRASQDSTLAYGGRSDRKGSMASSFGLGLGIADQGGADSFEELMQSGKTMKVSLTPDRLRTVEKLGRSASSRSQPMMSTSTAAPSLAGSGSPTSAARRYQARGPTDERGVIDEGEEGGQKGDSLTAMLRTPPPWQEDEETPSRRQSASNDAFNPMSVAMRLQNSQNSVQTMSSTMSSGSDFDSYVNLSPRSRQPMLKAKDERKDLAHERQINHDLADFFSNSPPPPSVSTFPTSASASTVQEEQWSPSTASSPSSAPKKAKKGFGSFFSSKSTKKTVPEVDSPAQRRDSTTSQSTSASTGRKNSRVRLNSTADPQLAAAAAMRASGFSEGAIRAASYSPPPNLAPSPSEPQRRTTKVTYSTAPPSLPTTGNERVSSIPLTTKSPRASPPAPATPADLPPPVAVGDSSVVNASPRAVTSAADLATTTSPPASIVPESSLSPAPTASNAPSPHLSIAPSFKTAHDGLHDDSTTPTVEKEKPSFGASPGLVAGAGIAALAGAASAALFGARSENTQTEEDAEPRPSAELKRSPAIPSGIAMASQELGYRSSDESMDRPNHTRGLSSDSTSTTGPSVISPESTSAKPAVTQGGDATVDESKEELLEPSATLQSLKVRMSSAQSAAECLALLETFIAQQSKTEVPPAQPQQNGTILSQAPQLKQTAEERRAEVQRSQEHARGRMDSWLSQVQLGGGWSSLSKSAVPEVERDAPTMSPKSPLQMKPLKLVQEWEEKQDKTSEKEAHGQDSSIELEPVAVEA